MSAVQSFEICRVGLWSEKCSGKSLWQNGEKPRERSRIFTLWEARIWLLVLVFFVAWKNFGAVCRRRRLVSYVRSVFLAAASVGAAAVLATANATAGGRRLSGVGGRTDGRRAIIGDRSRVVTARKPLGRLRNCARRPGPARAWRSLGRNLPQSLCFRHYVTNVMILHT